MPSIKPPSYPQEMLGGSNAWGVWRLAVDEDGEIYKQQVNVVGIAPNVNKPETLVDFEAASKVRDTLLSRPFDPRVEAYVKQNSNARRAGLIWLIQPGFVVLDYDDMKANPQYKSLYEANPTWIELSSRGNGVHQVFSHEDKPSGVIKDICDGIDARGAGTFLYTTGNSNPKLTAIEVLTPFFEDLISTRSREIHAQRQALRNRSAVGGVERCDAELIELFSEDHEAKTLAFDPNTSLNSDVMRVFVQRLSRYSADEAQMLRVFQSFPCASEANITLNKRRRKVTDVETLFNLHYDNMVKNGSLELPMVKFSLSMGQETTQLLPAVDLTQTLADKAKYSMPPFPKNMQVISDALDTISEIAADVSPPAVIQAVRMLAGDKLLTDAVYMTMAMKLRVSAQPSRAIVHFITLANSGRGKSRGYRRIRDFTRMLNAQYASDGTLCVLPQSPVRDMGKGMQGANRLALNLSLFEQRNACIALTDEAEANFASASDPGGSKAFLKEFTENVNMPGAMTVADKTTNGQRIELQDTVVQMSSLSTLKAMRGIIMNHLGDGLLARSVIWISNEPAIETKNWDGTIEVSVEDERIDLTAAAELCQRYHQAPQVTVTFPQELFQNTELFRRLLALNAIAAGADHDTEEDAYNRYVTYAQYLSAIYAWSEQPESPVHTEESLSWGIAMLEYAKYNSSEYFKDISRSVDTSTYQVKNAMNALHHANKYEAAVQKFYTEGTEFELLREQLKKAGRLSAKLDEKINERIMTVGMLCQYTLKFFGLTKVEVAGKVKDEALRNLALQGTIELKSVAGIVLDPPPIDLPSTTEIRWVNTIQ